MIVVLHVLHRYTHQHNKYGILKDIDCLQHSLESKMITERERLLKELGETYKEMVQNTIKFVLTCTCSHIYMYLAYQYIG